MPIDADRLGPVGPSGTACSAGAAGPGVAALESAALVLGEPAPDPGVLSGLQRPAKAGVHDVATTADDLGLLDLQQRRPGVPDREEQLRVLVEARCPMTPVHGEVHSFARTW